MKKLLFLALLTLSAKMWSVSAPANLALSAYSQNKTAFLYWDEDATVSTWNIYFGGNLRYSVARQDTSLTGTARRDYLMTGINPLSLPVVITMKALVPGVPISAESASITLTATSPTDYTSVYPAPMGWAVPHGDGIKPSVAVRTAAATSIWIPPVNKRFNLIAAYIDVPNGATSNTKSQIMTFYDGPLTVTTKPLNIPTAPLDTVPGSVTIPVFFGSGKLSAALGRTLTVTLSADLTSAAPASIYVTSLGTEEP